MYNQLSYTLAQQFPGIQVSGDNYPPTAVNFFLSRVFYGLFFMGLALNFGLSSMLPLTIRNWLNENRMVTFFGIFLCQMVASSLVQTGAFEVELDGQLIFSKLQSGHVPDLRDLVNIIRERLL